MAVAGGTLRSYDAQSGAASSRCADPIWQGTGPFFMVRVMR